MKNKRIVTTVLVIVVAIALMAALPLLTQSKAEEGTKHVTVFIVHKDGTEKKLEYSTDLEYLSQLLLEKELITGYESEAHGFTIESVDGISANWQTDGAYWALYDGDTYATVSVAGMALTDGGIYKLVYELV